MIFRIFNKNEPTDMSLALEQFHIREETEIAEQFSLLLEELPFEFQKWDNFFTPFYLNSSWKNHIKNEINVKLTWPISEKLINYALTPVSFMSSIHGFNLLLKKTPQRTQYLNVIRHNEVYETNDINNREIIDSGINFIIDGLAYSITLKDIVFFTDNHVVPENKMGMAKWLMAALEIKPDLIPQFLITKSSDNNSFVVTSTVIKKIPIVRDIPKDYVRGHAIKLNNTPAEYRNYVAPKEPFLSKFLDNTGMFLHTTGIALYFLGILITIPFIIVYGNVTYHIGKWWWKMNGRVNKT